MLLGVSREAVRERGNASYRSGPLAKAHDMAEAQRIVEEGAGAEDLEEEISALFIKQEVSEFVEDEQLRAGVLPQGAFVMARAVFMLSTMRLWGTPPKRVKALASPASRCSMRSSRKHLKQGWREWQGATARNLGRRRVPPMRRLPALPSIWAAYPGAKTRLR